MRRALGMQVIGLATAGLAAAALTGCGRADPPARAPADRAGPATARWDVLDLLRAGAAAHHHPADGGGRASLVHDPGEPPFTTRASRDRFRIVYEVGPHGIATGGSVQLQVSPFWGWSTPQVDDRDAPGFTEIHPE